MNEKLIEGLFVPMDLFGNDGTQLGCNLIYQYFARKHFLNQTFYNLNSMSRIKNWRKGVEVKLDSLLNELKTEKLVLFGGNHLAALPIYDLIRKGQNCKAEGWSIVRFDAHYDTDSGYKNLYIGNFMRSLSKELSIVNIGGIAKSPEKTYKWEIGAGCKSPTRHLRKFIEKGALAGDSIYIDFDVDVLNQKYFQSYQSHHEGGLSPRQCHNLIKIVMADRAWKRIVLSITEFSGLAGQTKKDIRIVYNIVATVFASNSRNPVYLCK